MIQAKDIQFVDPKLLKPNDKNRNTHPPEQIDRLVKLIQYQGFRAPIVVSNLSGKIAAGDGRRLAALKLGLKEVPVTYQDFENEEQEIAFGVSDNAIASWAELDMANIMEDIKGFGDGFDFDLFGIRNLDLSGLEPEQPGDPDEVPDVPVDPQSKLGDLYELGPHRLLCGDSTSIDAVERLMNGEKAEMIFTDPPYNQETDGGFKGMVGQALKKQSAEIEHICNFDPEAFLQIVPTVFASSKMNALIFCNKDLVVDYLKWARDCGYSYNILIWKKPNAIPIGGSYRPDVEYLLVFRKSGIWNGGLLDVSYSKLLEHGREKDKVHPTMKPVEMITNQLLISSNQNGNVMDFFGGSGSTLVACEKTKRKCFMIELDPKYVDVIVSRYVKYTGNNKIKLNGEEIEWDANPS